MSVSVEPVVIEAGTSTGGLLSPRRDALSRFLRHRLAALSLIVLIAIIIIAILAHVVAGHSPNEISLNAINQPPSSKHLLGTDDTGRDVWARVVYGAQTSLVVGFGAVAVAMLLGTAVGVTAGYLGGWVDQTLMRITDAFMSFPQLLLAIVFVAAIGPSLASVIIVIAVTTWPTGARVVRSQVLALKEQEFVVAARVIGVRQGGIVVRHLLPNLLGSLSIVGTFGVASAILTEASLGFLGLGIRPPTASWGEMINAAQSPVVLLDQPWIWVPPSVAICLTILAVNFIGDGLRDAIDPRSERG